MSDIKVPNGEPQPQGLGEDPLFETTKLFIRFLQLVFARFEKGSYQWSLDRETADIIIADQEQLREIVQGKKPAIICMRGHAEWGNIAMNQFAGPLRDRQTGTVTPNFDS